MKLYDLPIPDQIALFALALNTAEKVGIKLSKETYADDIFKIAESLSEKVQFGKPKN